MAGVAAVVSTPHGFKDKAEGVPSTTILAVGITPKTIAVFGQMP
jgi:hypothetical protein